MSQFVVSARKYRPTTFDEVVGQNHVAKTLKNALQLDQLAHAFLFCGPRGVGKTTCARILAKVINCLNPKDKVEPCNECQSCQSFNDNASFNIFELDAASNNSVEHIRNLIEQVRFQPQQGSHKVFIIDEVHMLSTQAFNAFLKTLEEPPPYAIFILATTEKHKILPTILSRCQIFDFKRIQPNDIVVQLEHICQSEGRQADTEALHQIAQKADGAMRDALSIYDKIASASAETITYQDVVVNLNLLDYDYFFRAVDACLKSDLSSLFLLFDEIVKSGFESEIFVQGLASHMRDLLVSKNPQTIQLMEGSADLKKRYYDQSIIASERFLLSGLNILNTCDLSLPRANNKRLQIELALAKLCYLGQMKEADVFASTAEKKTPSLTNQPKDAPQPAQQQVVAQSPIPEEVPSQTPPAPAPEPKQPLSTPEPVAEEQQTPAPTEESKEEIPAVIPETPTPTVSSPEPVDIPSAIPVSIPTPSVPNINAIPNALDIPMAVNSSSKNQLEMIKQRIKKEDQAQQAAQNNLSLENIQQEWDAYVNSHTSNSFKASLKNVILEYDNKEITAIVPSTVTMGFINQEAALMDKVRHKFGTPDLTLIIKIDKDKFPDMEEEDVVKTYFTRNEAIQEMTSKNPMLLEMMKQFDLKPDDGH